MSTVGEAGPATSTSRRRVAGGPGERGTVTAELALGLPAVVGVLLVVLVLSAVATSQLRCADAARAGARAAALGEDPAAITRIVDRVAGPGASTGVVRDGPWVTVTVRRLVATGPLARTALTVHAQASARVEP